MKDALPRRIRPDPGTCNVIIPIRVEGSNRLGTGRLHPVDHLLRRTISRQLEPDLRSELDDARLQNAERRATAVRVR